MQSHLITLFDLVARTIVVSYVIYHLLNGY
jgi:hypothetical protein